MSKVGAVMHLPHKRQHFLPLLLVPGLTLIASMASSEDSTSLVVGPFSDQALGNLPGGWKPLTFENIPRHTQYSIVHDESETAVRARAEAAASGLIRDIRIDPRAYPVITWRWKVANLIEHADVTRKDGDDYPARIYVIFRDDNEELGFWEKTKSFFFRLAHGVDPPTGALNYVWDTRAPVGTSLPNAYTARVHMIVVASGAANLNRWMTIERDMVADFRAAFGRDPPPIVGVAIMTDTDNTGESATAWYGDIVFKRGAP